MILWPNLSSKLFNSLIDIEPTVGQSNTELVQDLNNKKCAL